MILKRCPVEILCVEGLIFDRMSKLTRLGSCTTSVAVPPKDSYDPVPCLRNSLSYLDVSSRTPSLISIFVVRYRSRKEDSSRR